VDAALIALILVVFYLLWFLVDGLDRL